MNSDQANQTAVSPPNQPKVGDWHAVAHTEALDRLDTRREGLSEQEASRRLDRHGPNKLPEQRRRGPIARMLAQINNVLIYVLIGAAVLTAALGHWLDMAVILGVVVINAAIGYVQEGRAEHALAAIADMLAPQATVWRDGSTVRRDATELVPGDVIRLESGDTVPADARLIAARGLRAAEAALTGESVAVDKVTDPVDQDAALGDRASMVYSGTQIVAGRGDAVVTGTGQHTEIGRIGGMLQRVETTRTPLLKAVDRFARIISGAIVLVGAGVFLFGWLVRDYPVSDAFVAVVGLMVAAIPEGLPAVLTITLSIGVERMARHKAIVRRLPVVETLGAVTTICTDKTGTLTQNRMVVDQIALPDRVVDGEAMTDVSGPAHAWMLQIAELGTEATRRRAEGQTQFQGDPTEVALLALADRAEVDAEGMDRIDLLPFESERGFMAALYRRRDADRVLLVAKGAPERMLRLCQSVLVGDVAEPLHQERWLERVEAMARDGQRVLAAAYAELPANVHEIDNDALGKLVLVGLYGLIDPPRPEAIQAIADCRRAGIRVKMITGDHAVTARAIARDMGIADDPSAITGSALDGADDDRLADLAERHDVFARAVPEHKLRLVEALQAQGEVLAMTGDGVNDAPALKRADVGVAMGQNGTDAARAAASIVLADDNFATIARAVREGRTIYDNLKKAVTFLVPTSGGEALTIIAAILVGSTLPITALQILWINMVTAVTLGLALAFDPAEPGIMERPPRQSGEPLLSGVLAWLTIFASLVILAGVMIAFYGAEMWTGADLEAARTVAVNALVALEAAFLFSVRYSHQSALTLSGLKATPAIWIAVALVAGFQLVFTYLPLAHILFDTAPLSMSQLGLSIAIGAGGFLIFEVEKLARIRLWSAGDRPTGKRDRHANAQDGA